MISSGPIEDRLAIRELVDSYNDAVMRMDGRGLGSQLARTTARGAWVGTTLLARITFFPIWQKRHGGVYVRRLLRFSRAHDRGRR